MAKSKVTDFKKVGEGIRIARMTQMLSRESLGAKIGISGATIANIENNAEKALYKNIIAIVEALGINLEDISY